MTCIPLKIYCEGTSEVRNKLLALLESKKCVFSHYLHEISAALNDWRVVYRNISKMKIWYKPILIEMQRMIFSFHIKPNSGETADKMIPFAPECLSARKFVRRSVSSRNDVTIFFSCILYCADFLKIITNVSTRLWRNMKQTKNYEQSKKIRVI